MHTPSAPKTVPPTVKTYSACWTDELGAAIAAATPKRGYHMSLTGEDGRRVVSAVNQGIDAHLEACFIPDRGDSFRFQNPPGIQGRVSGSRLECNVSPESLVVLVRRLLESSDDAAQSLASSICQTLGIELV